MTDDVLGKCWNNTKDLNEAMATTAAQIAIVYNINFLALNISFFGGGVIEVAAIKSVDRLQCGHMVLSPAICSGNEMGPLQFWQLHFKSMIVVSLCTTLNLPAEISFSFKRAIKYSPNHQFGSNTQNI